jgi:hypothetical protein
VGGMMPGWYASWISLRPAFNPRIAANNTTVPPTCEAEEFTVREGAMMVYLRRPRDRNAVAIRMVNSSQDSTKLNLTSPHLTPSRTATGQSAFTLFV